MADALPKGQMTADTLPLTQYLLVSDQTKTMALRKRQMTVDALLLKQCYLASDPGKRMARSKHSIASPAGKAMAIILLRVLSLVESPYLYLDQA